LSTRNNQRGEKLVTAGNRKISVGSEGQKKVYGIEKETAD